MLARGCSGRRSTDLTTSSFKTVCPFSSILTNSSSVLELLFVKFPVDPLPFESMVTRNVEHRFFPLPMDLLDSDLRLSPSLDVLDSLMASLFTFS